ncbi:M56 family metallopeptidase [Amycolatopsis rhabdoformis]|uniref:M56 family metallopeptidase n=1 Tax=Amycolatopsis rhabdoformis TaxID=1448059 RepID=A0ABZ1IGP7_9PSEU|nr:M56 family metallopeptidase [Amycolatopsis rhabdoformis]WSE33635.1 M56 family metallopeptidase [Amycolatopsis rhabdoformis]
MTVYPGLLAPLILPLLSWPVARWLAPRMSPPAATLLLTFLALVFAAGSTAALTLGAAAGLSEVPLVADLGDFSASALSSTATVPAAISITCGVLLPAAVVSATAAVRDQWRWYRRVHRELDEHSPADGVVILPGTEPVAFAIAGRGGRIAVSRGMLAALDGSERAALLLHERAHLRLRHASYAAAGVLAAAVNPLVRPLVTTARFTMERWADETAASGVGDRRVVATAVAKAALAGHQSSYALAAAGGPVPQRVRALLDSSPSGSDSRRRGLLTAVAVAVVLGGCGWSAGAGAQAVLSLHADIEAARPASCALEPVVPQRPHGQALLTTAREDHRECAER